VLTLNQIIAELRSLGLAHHQINSFYFGDLWETDVQPDVVFPLMGATLLPGNISEKTEQTKILLYFCDLVNKDESNETHVLSDMKQVALGVFAQFRNFLTINGIKLVQEAPLNSFTERWDHEATGWSLEITVNQFYSLGACAEPSSYEAEAIEYGSVIIYNRDTGATVATVNPGGSYPVIVFSGISDDGPPYTDSLVDE
jgi:hypothetical protein